MVPVLLFLFTFIQVKSNAVRALGYLSRFIRFNHHCDAVDNSRLVILCMHHHQQQQQQSL